MTTQETPITKPALKFSQTDRIGWTTNMTIEEITTLLPARPSDQLALFTETNRPINSRHMDGIVKFLDETIDWAMPSIILAADPGRVQEQDNTITVRPATLRILDGQHRLEAIAALTHRLGYTANIEDQEREQNSHKLQSLKDSEIPVVIFQVKTLNDQKQMFAWFARNRPIESTNRNYFDQADPFNNAAKGTLEQSQVLQCRVDHTKTRTKATDNCLFTLNELKSLAETLVTGTKRGASRQDREYYKTQPRQDEIQSNLVRFFDDFLPTCGQDYAKLTKSAALDNELAYPRNGTYAYDYPVLRLILNAWARWVEDTSNENDQLANAIATLNLSKTNPENDVSGSLKLLDQDTLKFKNPRDKAWQEATYTLMSTARKNETR